MTLRLADNTLYFIIHYQRLWAHYGLTSFPEECSHTEDSVSGGHIFYLKKKEDVGSCILFFPLLLAALS